MWWESRRLVEINAPTVEWPSFGYKTAVFILGYMALVKNQGALKGACEKIGVKIGYFLNLAPNQNGAVRALTKGGGIIPGM